MNSISNTCIGDSQYKLDGTPSALISASRSRAYIVDESVKRALPIPGTKVLHALNYGHSLWGKAVKIVTQLPSGGTENYFLKVVSLGDTGRHMCQGEFESLKAIYEISPDFVPRPYAWGKYEKPEKTDGDTYFLLAEFRHVGQQPADPVELGTRLADMHRRSVSPTGKFGFHIATCHAKIAQAVDSWEDSWSALYSKHLSHVMELAKPVLQWPQFDAVCTLTLEKVVPRLLLPLQSEGRILKPCLVHGNCWDENTAMDTKTGEAFVFDVCSFYGHNEYDTGNWRAPRHRLSNLAYIKNYKKCFPVSEPEEDWDARNLLYSLTFNIGNAIYIPGSNQRQVVYDDMTTLCRMFCPEDLDREISFLNNSSQNSTNHLTTPGEGRKSEDKEEDEEEEEDEVVVVAVKKEEKKKVVTAKEVEAIKEKEGKELEKEEGEEPV